MNNKALYWIALGVFALALNSQYQDGKLSLAHRVSDRAQAVFCQIASHAEQSLAVAGLLIERPRPEFRIDDEFMARQQAEVERVMAEHQAELDRAMALRQADLDRVQRQLSRVHVVFDRAQVEKLRKLQRMSFKLSDATNRRMVVVCPETGARISVNAGPDLSDLNVDVSDVE